MQMVEFKDLDYSEVAGKQIVKALNLNIGEALVRGDLYQLQQNVANEARKRGLLTNPNPHGHTAYVPNDVSKMVPSATGWEMTKGIQMRFLRHA